jgi:hypothetical protein
MCGERFESIGAQAGPELTHCLVGAGCVGPDER